MNPLFTFAILPGIILMIYIYIKDSREKEPLGFLIGLFFMGALSVIPTIILETIFDFVGGNDSLISIIIKYVFMVGFIEELVKFSFLYIFSMKSKNFNYSFDAIVYSVFVSLGFATIENLLYVFQGGIGIAILRALTAVPGHASFAVIMGYFYSKIKKAQVEKNYSKYISNLILAVLVPMLVHGIYDTLAMTGTIISFLIFVVYVILMFVCCIIIIKRAALKDSPFVSIVYQAPRQWFCTRCGQPNVNRFCIKCGAPNITNNINQ